MPGAAQRLQLAGKHAALLNCVCVCVRACVQPWGDADVPELLTSMEDKLRHGVQLLSSFDKYRKELLSGHLDWGPTHTSESFWRKNVDKFEERDFFVLRTLLKLIETSQEVRLVGVRGRWAANAEADAVHAGKAHECCVCFVVVPSSLCGKHGSLGVSLCLWCTCKGTKISYGYEGLCGLQCRGAPA